MSKIFPDKLKNINLSIDKQKWQAKKTGFFQSVKNIPYNFKNRLLHAKNSYLKSWKLQLILKTFLIMLFINIILMSQGNHYEVDKNPEDILTNSFYLTTTQLTTIGYGDITPISATAKLITSCAHLVIAFIAYSLAEEFGALSKIAERQEVILNENIKPMNSKMSITPEFRDEILQKYAENRKKSFEDLQAENPKERIENVIRESALIGNTANTVKKAADKFFKPVAESRVDSF
jgi:hypothetical protein